MVRDIVAGAPAGSAGTARAGRPTPAEHYTVRLNPLLVAGLAPKSLRPSSIAAAHPPVARRRRERAADVLITSPQKGEGKSVTSANLALTMAQELQRRVVLVEADLRKPSLQYLFGLPAAPGSPTTSPARRS